MNLKRITPFLWFNDNAEEAVNFYVSIFNNSKIGNISRQGKASSEATKMAEGKIMVMGFELDGQSFMALNGGPMFQFTHAISFVVNCETQEEIDHYWNKLSEGGTIEQCGWLKDKFGLSWQIVPTILGELMGKANPEKANKVMQVVMQCIKFNIEDLKKAAS